MLSVHVTYDILEGATGDASFARGGRVGPGEVGAWVEFRGIVRRIGEGAGVVAMTYDGHVRLIRKAVGRMADAVARAASAPWDGRIVLRLGRVDVGDVGVVIATTSAHRAAAYEANLALLEGLKRQVPIWKCEHYDDGTSVWLDGRSLRAELDEW